MAPKLRPLVYGLAAGIVGVLLTLTVVHLYLDHVRVDQIWQLELNRAAAAQAAPK